jgi:hypothetical protein
MNKFSIKRYSIPVFINDFNGFVSITAKPIKINTIKIRNATIEIVNIMKEANIKYLELYKNEGNSLKQALKEMPYYAE